MSDYITRRYICRWCSSPKLVKFLDLGDMPLAGGFVRPEQFQNEQKIPLEVYICENCKLAQICHIVDPVVLFKNYFYISSVIKSLAEHFLEYSQFLRSKYLSKWSKLIEMGCNDGVLLQYFKDNSDIFSIWIDPSENVAKLAQDKWLRVINDFFSPTSAKKINTEYGKFDVLTGSNMFAHIDDIISIINAAKIILKNDWVFIFEVHYLLDLIKEFQYDTIYHEHLTYYSIISIKYIFELQDMKVIEVQHLNMHGGWIRVVTALNGSSHIIEDSVEEFIKEEVKYGLDSLDIYMGLWDKVTAHKKALSQTLISLKQNGKTITWYGAPGRGTILLNYCEINKDIIDYIVDVSPLRKGMYTPWVHIPIVDPTEARNNPPDYFLVLAWNYIDSILLQESWLIEKGTKFIVPFPTIKII